MAVKFSILVVCLNPGAKLAETVESIRKQEYRDYEIIVKDESGERVIDAKLYENNDSVEI